MTLVQLEYIIALERYKHFSKAAAFCNITQPSLSMQIQKLEEELKTTIFARTNPVALTETGMIIIEQAKKIIAEAAMIKELIHQQKNTVEGILKIGIIPTLAPYLLPLFLQSFIKRYPAVKLSISELTTERIIKQLKNGTLDAGILATPVNQTELQENVLFNEEFVGYVIERKRSFQKNIYYRVILT